jgi:hypothetical protein
LAIIRVPRYAVTSQAGEESESESESEGGNGGEDILAKGGF